MTETWKPFPKQEQALLSTAFETLFGGSRGPGKTDAGLVWLTYDIEHPRYRALVIRKNADDLSDWIDRARRFYGPFGAKIAYRPAVITLPWGGVIKTGHLKDDQAYTKYQGHEYPRMLIEELTQIATEKRYLQLIASCRSTIPELKPMIFNTTNPGGVGHTWVKNRFVDPAPPNTYFKDKTSGRTRIFIPATLDDNPILKKVDPGYIKQMDALKDVDVELWKAWRLGDWDTFAGQYFRAFRRDLHVISSHFHNNQGYLIAGLDWGRADNFSFHLNHVFPVKFEGVTFYRVITFMEVYGNGKDPKYWAKKIVDRLDGRGISLQQVPRIMSDNQIFQATATDDGITIADQFYKANNLFEGRLEAASKNRVGGWESMQNWLSMAPDGLPYWLITEDCNELIKEIPSAIHDENKVEDIDDSGVDDALDESRYMFSALKWIDANVEGVGRGTEDTARTTLLQEKSEWDE